MEPGPPARLSLTSRPGCELLTVTNGADLDGRTLLPEAVLQLQDAYGNACYVQDVAVSATLVAQDGELLSHLLHETREPWPSVRPHTAKFSARGR